jgi:hypothetical protein
VNQAQPAITELGDGQYQFTPSDADEAAGVIYLLNNGAGNLPRYLYDAICLPTAPFAAWVTFDAGGALSSGAPTVGSYVDFAALVRTPPAVQPTGAIPYMFWIQPTAADLLIGVAFRLDAPAGKLPAFVNGEFFSVAAASSPGAVTLNDLRTRVRERADMPVSGFITNTRLSIDAWINEGVQKLWELLIKAYGQAFVEKSATFTTVAGSTDVALPSDFFILYGVDLAIGNVFFSLMQFNHTERNLYRNMLALAPAWRQRPRYRLSGMGTTGILKLLPAPDGAYTGTLWYAPAATLLVNGTDALLVPNGWERFVVLYAAMQCLMKEESSTREYRIELDKMEAELSEIAARRNADLPHSVVDSETVENDSPLNYF